MNQLTESHKPQTKRARFTSLMAILISLKTILAGIQEPFNPSRASPGYPPGKGEGLVSLQGL
jgi:hypothetical protein